MELHTFAYTVGIMELLIGLPLLFYSKSVMKWIDKLFKDEPMMRVLGAFMVILGGLVLINGYEISSSPAGLVTLVAWLTFLKGVVWSWYPQTAINMKKKWAKNEALLTFGGLAATGIGFLLMYAGSVL